MKRRGVAAIVGVAIALATTGVANAAVSGSNDLCDGLTSSQCTRYVADLKDYSANLKSWNSQQNAINIAYKSAVKDAISTFQTEYARASTPSARRAASDRYTNALRVADIVRDDAIDDLGPAPKVPRKPTSRSLTTQSAD